MNPNVDFEPVQREIAYAYENVAFIRAHMDRHGLVPANFNTPDDLLQLPPTRKADYRRNFPAGVIAHGHSLAGKYVMRFQSSGTGGERLNSAVLAYDLARRQATCLEVNATFNPLWRPGLKLRTCRYAPPNCSDVECSTVISTMADRILPDGTLVLPVAHDLLTTPASTVDKALDEIAAYDPHLLIVDPTHFAFLIRRMQCAGRQPHKREGIHVICGYSLLTKVSRRQIAGCFGANVPVADMLGMSELGYLGFECSAGSQHLNNRDFYIEFLCYHRNAMPGELAELVVTTIEDALSPHIRYATGDLYRFTNEPCSCGSSLPVVRLEGRATNLLRCGNGSSMTPRELDEVIGDAPWIDLYRIEQNRTGAFWFHYLANELASPELEAELAARLREALATKCLSMVPTSYIPCDRGGKFMNCVSETSLMGVG